MGVENGEISIRKIELIKDILDNDPFCLLIGEIIEAEKRLMKD